jgi:hypothetical protein
MLEMLLLLLLLLLRRVEADGESDVQTPLLIHSTSSPDRGESAIMRSCEVEQESISNSILDIADSKIREGARLAWSGDRSDSISPKISQR